MTLPSPPLGNKMAISHKHAFVWRPKSYTPPTPKTALPLTANQQTGLMGNRQAKYPVPRACGEGKPLLDADGEVHHNTRAAQVSLRADLTQLQL